MPASLKMARSSLADLKRFEFGSMSWLHSGFFEPGIAPPRLLAPGSVPQNSPSLRASTICNCPLLLSDVRIDCLVASRSFRGWALKLPAVGFSGDLFSSGKFADRQAAKPPLSNLALSTPQ